VQVYAVDHGSPQLTGTTTVYVTVEGSHRPYFEPDNYIFSVRESQPLPCWLLYLYLLHIYYSSSGRGWLGSRVVSVLDSGAEGPGSNRSRDAVV